METFPIFNLLLDTIDVHMMDQIIINIEIIRSSVVFGSSYTTSYMYKCI